MQATVTLDTSAPDSAALVKANLTDEQLLAQYLGGCRDSIATLYRRHNHKLQGYLRKSFSLDSETIEDVAQFAWTWIIEKPHQFHTNGRFRSWLYSIAIHRAICVRRRGSFALLDQDISDTEAAPIDPSDVREAVDTLFQDQWQVIDLVYFKGLTYANAAQQIGVARSTLALRLGAARNSLRRSLA